MFGDWQVGALWNDGKLLNLDYGGEYMHIYLSKLKVEMFTSYYLASSFLGIEQCLSNR